jgi:hypothetical protein
LLGVVGCSSDIIKRQPELPPKRVLFVFVVPWRELSRHHWRRRHKHISLPPSLFHLLASYDILSQSFLRRISEGRRKATKQAKTNLMLEPVFCGVMTWSTSGSFDWSPTNPVLFTSTSCHICLSISRWVWHRLYLKVVNRIRASRECN